MLKIQIFKKFIIDWFCHLYDNEVKFDLNYFFFTFGCQKLFMFNSLTEKETIRFKWFLYFRQCF